MKRWQTVFKSCKIGLLVLSQVLHIQSIQLIFGMNFGWLSISEMRQDHVALMMFTVNHGLCPSYLLDMFDVNYTLSRLSYDLRSSRMNLIVLKARTNYFRNSFASAGHGAKLWNFLPFSLKEETSFKQFQAKIRSYILFTQGS